MNKKIVFALVYAKLYNKSFDNKSHITLDAP